MRIVIWTDGFWPEIGGLEIFCMKMAEALQERVHDCLVVTERKKPADLGVRDYHGIPVHGVAFEQAARRGDLGLLRRQHEACADLLDNFAPDVIHLNTVMRGAMGFLLQQRRRRRPAVLTLHNACLHQHARTLGPAMLKNVDCLAAISEHMRAYLLSCDRQLEPKIQVILNALPTPVEEPAPLSAPARLLALGRLVPEKGFDLAIGAFAQIASDFPDAILTIAGQGKAHENLLRLADETGCSARIHFPGWIVPDEIAGLINRHSIVLMPSRWDEPFGLVALQAAQMGRPIIAARVGALPEIVVEEITGKLVERENVPALSQALRYLLETPPLGEKLGRQASLHVASQFSFKHCVAEYEHLYIRAKHQ
jgi:glycogen(starch) synthase